MSWRASVSVFWTMKGQSDRVKKTTLSKISTFSSAVLAVYTENIPKITKIMLYFYLALIANQTGETATFRHKCAITRSL